MEPFQPPRNNPCTFLYLGAKLPFAPARMPDEATEMKARALRLKLTRFFFVNPEEKLKNPLPRNPLPCRENKFILSDRPPSINRQALKRGTGKMRIKLAQSQTQWAIEDDPKRAAFLGMSSEKDHRFLKIRIRHSGMGHQK